MSETVVEGFEPMKQRTVRACAHCGVFYRPPTRRSYWCSIQCRKRFQGPNQLTDEQVVDHNLRRHITASQIASDLQISRAGAYRMARQMPHTKVGRTLRVDREDYDRWLAAHKAGGGEPTIVAKVDVADRLSCANCEKQLPEGSGFRYCSTRCKELLRGRDPQRREYLRAYSKRRSESGLDMARRHGVSLEVMQAWFAAGCYYPGGNHDGPLGVDHDHSCCSGRYGCARCSRGLLCRKHNVALGGIELDLEFARWAVQQAWIKEKVRVS